MVLQKKTLSFPLAKGINEKASEPSLGIDSLKAADNVHFEKTGQLRKRGGFVLTNSAQNYVAAGTGGSVGDSGSISSGVGIVQYQNETLVFDGNRAYSKITAPPATNVLVDKGTFVPMTVENKVKRRVPDRRQGNAQIAEANGIRVYVWAEYQFYPSVSSGAVTNQYQVRYDAEDIETGTIIQSNKLLAGYDIAITGTNRLYDIPRPQCLAVSNRIFFIYQDPSTNKITYRSIDCTSSTTVAQGKTAGATLQDTSGGSGVDIALDATYPIFSVDNAGTQTLASGGVLAYFTGSAFKVQYLEVSGTALNGTTVATVSITAAFAQYAKGPDTVLPSEIFVKTLSDSAAVGTAAIVFGCTANVGGTAKVHITLLSDNLANQVSFTDATNDQGGSGHLFLLAGTAGTLADGATDIYVPVSLINGASAITAEAGAADRVSPHWSRVYKISISSRTISSISSSSISVYKDKMSYCSTITSDAFRVGSSLYFAMSVVNDNLLGEDILPDFRLRRGLSNTLAVVNHNGEIIGATKMGQCATCVTSEYVTLNPAQYTFADDGASVQSNRRLWFGVQRVLKDASSNKYRFGASRFAGYINTSKDVAATMHNYDPDTIFGISLVTCDFDPDRAIASADADGSLVLTGGVLHGYDGDRIFENDFVVSPSISRLVQSGASANTYVAGGTVRGFTNGLVLKYSVIYEWGDSNGNIYRSAPAPFNEVTIATGGVKTVGTVTGGSGYTNGTFDVTMGGGSGTGAVFNITVSGGAVQSVNSITSQGSGYTNGETLTFPDGSSGSVPISAVYNTNRVLVYVRPLPPALTRKGGITESYTIGGATHTPTGKGVNILVYRTEGNGNIFYEVGSLPLLNEIGATGLQDEIAFVDMPPDHATVVNAAPLYPTDGTAQSGCFGSCTDLVKHQNKVFAAAIDDNVYMSVPLTDGEAVRFPADTSEFQINFPGDASKLTAIEGNLDHFVMFTEDNGFFVSGRGPDRLGAGAFPAPRLFASGQGAKPGAAHTDSPVGVFYQGERGIYLVGRDMSINYIGASVEDRTSKLAVNMLRHDPTNEVRIMLSNAGTSSGSDQYLIYNYYFQQWSRYTIAYTSSAHQIAEVYNGSSFQRLTADGKQWEQSTTVFQDNSTNYDMVVDTGFISPSGILKKDRVYRFMYLGEYMGAHEAEAQIYVDYKTGDEASPTLNITQAPSDIYLYRVHMPSQKNRAIRIKLVLSGSTEAARLNGIAFEVGIRPESTNFKTSQDRTY